MLTEHKFGDLSNSMASGFFADSIVLSLARTEKNRTVDEQDAKTLGSAVVFFKRALQGNSWLDEDQLTFNEQSFESAISFDRAVRVVGRRVTSPRAFQRYIEELKETAEVLAQRRVPDNSRLQVLHDFFSLYSQLELANTQNILQRNTRTAIRQGSL